MPTTRRLPVSSRHAFALAFDLAVRRDFVHSIVVPMLLQLPWALLAAFLPPLHGSPVQIVLTLWLRATALLGIWLTGLLVTAMLRFRARSVFHSSLDTRPSPARECYALGIRAVPALFVTEVLRAASFVVGSLLLFLPGLFLGFKFSMATETVVLRSGHEDWRRELRALLLVLLFPIFAIPALTLVPYLMVPARAWIVWPAVAVGELVLLVVERRALFSVLLGGEAIPALKHSFRITEGRWERWLEMIAISVMLIVPVWFLLAVGAALTPANAWVDWVFVGSALTQASLLVIQYAWTFFYMRLEDSDVAGLAGASVVVPPVGGAAPGAWRGGSAPRLKLVELPPDRGEDAPPRE